MDVQRAHPIPMTCACRLRKGGGYDSCQCTTSGPDEPICHFCVIARHHQQDNFDPIVKGDSHAGARVHVVRLDGGRL